jgi:hypothetical protein
MEKQKAIDNRYQWLLLAISFIWLFIQAQCEPPDSLSHAGVFIIISFKLRSGPGAF